MAKRLEKHQQRLDNLNRFGKELARRCSSSCELCAATGTKLQIHEVPPVPSEPEFEHCILICEQCKQHIDKPKNSESNHWRCLSSSAWSENPAIQVMAVILLKQMGKEIWAQELLEQLYLSPESEAWLQELNLS